MVKTKSRTSGPEASDPETPEPGFDAGIPAPDGIPDVEVVLKDTVAPELPEKPQADPGSATRRRRGVFFPLVLGGALAAAAGAGSVVYLFPDGLRGATATESALAALSARLDRQDETLAKGPAADAFATQVASVAAEAARLSDAQARAVASTNAELTRLSQGLASLDARLTTLEQNPVSGDAATAAATAAFRREIDALKLDLVSQQKLATAARSDIAKAAEAAAARIAEAEAQAAQLRAKAESAGAAAAARAAVGRLALAVDAGTPLQPAIDELAANGVAIPATISESASGVPSVEALRLAFADAARVALAESLTETAPATWSGRIAAFLRAETGARSLVPRDGTDPDAVLSRAEAALAAGDLTQALAELDGLPPGGRAKVEDWMAATRKRIDLQAAIDALAVGLE